MSKRPDHKVAPPSNRRTLSRRAQEAKQRRQLIIGTAVVLGVVLVLLTWAIVDHYVLKPRKPVAAVSGEEISLETYQKRVNYRRWDYANYLAQLESQRQQFAAGGEEQAFLVQYMDQQIQQAQTAMMTLPNSVLDELIDAEITRQECDLLGLTVSEEAVQLELETQFGYDRNPPTPTPTPITHTLPITVTPTPTIAPMTAEEFDQQRVRWAELMVQSAGGFDEDDFRGLLREGLLREKLEESLKTGFPTTEDQVHASHILLATAETAQEVLDRLEAGEAFEDLAAELSTDESNRDTGGDLGWFPRGQMVGEFEEAVFAMVPGETSGIVETQFGFHIIRLVERDPNRELDESTLASRQAQMIADWYEARRAGPEVVRSWDSTMVPTAVPVRRY